MWERVVEEVRGQFEFANDVELLYLVANAVDAGAASVLAQSVDNRSCRAFLGCV